MLHGVTETDNMNHAQQRVVFSQGACCFMDNTNSMTTANVKKD